MTLGRGREAGRQKASQAPLWGGTHTGVSKPANPAAIDPDAPRLSVVIVNWNGAGYLAECLGSARAPDRELIVVDNGSSDGSTELVARQFPGAVWLPLGANLGFAYAANRGLERARARLVLFLNPDARSSEAAVAAATRALDDDPRIGLVSVALRTAAGIVTPTVEPFFSLSALLRARADRRASSPSGPGPVDVDWCHGAFLLARKSDLAELGGFDERYFLYSEDMDLCFRMHESGRRVVYLPEVSIVHHGNLAGAARFGEARAAQIFASSLKFYAMHHGRLARLALRSLAAVAFGVRAVWLRSTGSPLAARYASLFRVALSGTAPHVEPELQGHGFKRSG